MCVVYVIVGVGQKFQNENVRKTNLNNYKTLKMRVIIMTESYKCSFLVSKIKKLKNSDFVVLRFWPSTGSYLYYCNFIKKRDSNTGVFL